MDYTHFMGSCLSGLGIALAILLLLGAKRRALVPPLAWWLFLAIGTVICFYGMSHSTFPSFSPRVTAVGKAYDYQEREIHTGYHHDSVYSFLFVPEGGKPLRIETQIILPGWADPTIFNGRTFRVVYLQDAKRPLKNEAIEIQILSGAHMGYNSSLDARPFGAWLGIPLGAAFSAFGVMGLKRRKDDAKSMLPDGDDDPSARPRP